MRQGLAIVFFLSHALYQGLFPSVAQAQPNPRARVLFSSNVDGAFAQPQCDEEVSLEPSAIVYSLSRALGEQARSRSTFLLDTGNLLAPHGVARFATEYHHEALAELIHALGYHALALGTSELAAPRESMLQVLQALRRRGIPTIATNLFCGEAAAKLCDALVDGSDGVPILEAGEEKLAIVNLLAPTSLAQVSSTLREGVRLAPVAATLQAAAKRARERGATLVLAIVHTKGQSALSDVAKLASELPDDAQPDIVLAASGGEEVLFARPRKQRPAIAATERGRLVELQIRQEGERLDIVASPLEKAPEPAEAVARFIETVGSSYCERWGRALPGAKLGDESLDGEGLLALSAGIVRHRTNAEVVLLNRGVADGRLKPVKGRALTASEIYIALHYDEEIVVADVDAKWLKTLATGLKGDKLLALGIELKDAGTPKEKLKINGKDLDPDVRYRVATLRFLASGGDELLAEGPAWQSTSSSLREAVLTFLSEEREGDPRDALRDPAERVQWELRMQLDGTFAASVASNSSSYEATQLARADTTTFGLETKIDFGATAKSFGWENTIEGRYASTRAAMGSFEEGNDLLSYRTNLRYRGLRQLLDRPYIPEPFFEAYGESELTTAEGRGYHHLLVRPTAGLRFSLTKHLNLKLAGGGEKELLDPDGRFLFGLGGMLELKPWSLLTDAEAHRKLELAFLIDYFIGGLGSINRQTLRSRLDASFAWNRHLSIALLVEVFGMKESGSPIGFAASTTAALRARWAGRVLSP